jgi:hypothetical protein
MAHLFKSDKLSAHQLAAKWCAGASLVTPYKTLRLNKSVTVVDKPFATLAYCPMQYNIS